MGRGSSAKKKKRRGIKISSRKYRKYWQSCSVGGLRLDFVHWLGDKLC